MIQRLCVQGFQSLSAVDIELGQFTVLVGPSNSGKSAIRRAIQALVSNDPPAGRLREGASQIVVSLVVDGTIVNFVKGKKTTSYTVGDEAIDKPGASCPPAVTELLRLDEVNFAGQFDQPYLLAETPSAVARALGELTNITVLFEGIREATRRQRAATQEGNTLGNQAQALTEQIQGYADLPAEQAKLEAASAALTTAAQSDADARLLYAAAQHAQELSEAVASVSATLATQPDWDALEGTITAVETLMAERELWRTALARATSLAADICSAEQALGDGPNALVDWDATFTQLEANERLATNLTHDAGRARELAAEISHAEARMNPADHELAAQAELAAIKVCPLCEQPIEGDLCSV